jgi:hypothetical protein
MSLTMFKLDNILNSIIDYPKINLRISRLNHLFVENDGSYEKSKLTVKELIN